MVVFGQKWLFLGKVVEFVLKGCIWARVVLLRQKWLYSAKWFYSGKEVVVGQNWLY